MNWSHIVPLWVLYFFISWYKQSSLSNSCGQSICLVVAVVTAACLTGPRGSLDCGFMQTNFLTKSFQTWKLHFNALLVSGREAKCKIIFKSKLFPSAIVLCRGRQRSKCFIPPLHSCRYEGAGATGKQSPVPYPRPVSTPTCTLWNNSVTSLAVDTLGRNQA